MRHLTFTLLISLFLATALTAQAQEDKKPEQKPAAAPETTTDAEKPKNEVDEKIAEATKRGGKVIGVCIDPVLCGDKSGQQILNLEKGRVVNLVQPSYSALARAGHAQGAVVVKVLIDGKGKVIAAAAISGHPLLYPTCVKAARESMFTPTLLEGEPVSVTGVIQYNFVAQ